MKSRRAEEDTCEEDEGIRELEGEMERVEGFCCCSNGMSTSATKAKGMGGECRGP